MLRILIVFIISITALVASTEVLAYHDGFSYNSDEVNLQLAPLNKLEQLHFSHPDKSFAELVSEKELAEYSFSSVSNLQNGLNDTMPLVPAFWWGCVFGWIGILIVFLVTQDSEQTRSALWGCITTYVLGCLFYVVLVVWAGVFTIF